jgi:hypothetical protein
MLSSAVSIRAAPGGDAPVLAALAPGKFVYRCEGATGSWRAVRFASPGEPLNCSSRAPAKACPTGWVEGPLRAKPVG